MEESMKRLLAVVVLLALILTSGIIHASAQSSPADEGTPPGMEFPDPSECTVEPASIDHLTALFDAVVAAGPATPSAEANAAVPTPPTGQPADAQTIAEINAAWREFIACLNSGDMLRAFSFHSDAKLTGIFTVDVANGFTDSDQLVAFFSATPVPVHDEHRAPYVPNQDLRVLPDGRVAWVSPDEVLIWIKVGGRWLIDDQFNLPASGTPTP
jgi:hypothetical protein